MKVLRERKQPGENDSRGGETEKMGKIEIEMKAGRMLSHGRQGEGGGRRNDRNKKEDRGTAGQRERERDWGKNKRVKRAIITEP